MPFNPSNFKNVLKETLLESNKAINKLYKLEAENITVPRILKQEQKTLQTGIAGSSLRANPRSRGTLPYIADAPTTNSTRLIPPKDSSLKPVNKANETEQLISETDNPRKTLFHYTNEQGLHAILESKQLNPSIKAMNPKDAWYGNGQYLSDVTPETTRRASLGAKFIRRPNKYKFTHYLELDVTDLNIKFGRKGVFLHENDGPLDISNRIIRSGEVKV